MKPRKFTVMMIVLWATLAAGCATTPAEKAASSPAEKVATPEPSKAAATAPAIPDAIKAPANEQKSLEVYAKGVQIYICAPKKDDATQFEWTLKAPEAELTDSQGKKLGKHSGGPSWEATDGSKVIGDRDKVKSSPPPDANAIPWLWLPTKSTAGKGVFSQVKSIQRVSTEGGKAPTTGCDKAYKDRETRVDYQATYYFYVTKS